MSKAAHLANLQQQLHRHEERLAADEKRLAEGTPKERVEAAGDLAIARQRIEATRQKIEHLEAAPDTGWENLKAEIEQDLGFIESAFDRWLVRKG